MVGVENGWAREDERSTTCSEMVNVRLSPLLCSIFPAGELSLVSLSHLKGALHPPVTAFPHRFSFARRFQATIFSASAACLQHGAF